jgi:hypothetical protein
MYAQGHGVARNDDMAKYLMSMVKRMEAETADSEQPPTAAAPSQ